MKLYSLQELSSKTSNLVRSLVANGYKIKSSDYAFDRMKVELAKNDKHSNNTMRISECIHNNKYVFTKLFTVNGCVLNKENTIYCRAYDNIYYVQKH